MKEPDFEGYLESLVARCISKEFGRLMPLMKQATEEEDRLMTLEELQKFLPEKPARQTVYGWVNNRIIPFEKHGKRLFFRKSRIDFWLSNGRKPNNFDSVK